MASSSSGGSGSGGTSGGSRPPGSGGYSSGQPPRGGGSGGSGGQPPFSSSGRPMRPSAPAGQERTVSYQREEERYWTDYLRVALPVIGLLLLLGLFWYWAQSLIGDDSEEEPTAIAEVITEPSPTPTVQQPVDVVTTPGGADGGQTDGGQEAEPTEVPTEGAAANGQQTDAQEDGSTDQTAPDDGNADQSDVPQDDGEFAIEDSVVVNDQGDGLRLRTDPEIVDTNIVDELPAGRQLIILDGPTEAEGYIWYQVEDQETGEQGWVADDGFLDPA